MRFNSDTVETNACSDISSNFSEIINWVMSSPQKIETFGTVYVQKPKTRPKKIQRSQFASPVKKRKVHEDPISVTNKPRGNYPWPPWAPY